MTSSVEHTKMDTLTVPEEVLPKLDALLGPRDIMKHQIPPLFEDAPFSDENVGQLGKDYWPLLHQGQIDEQPAAKDQEVELDYADYLKKHFFLQSNRKM